MLSTFSSTDILGNSKGEWKRIILFGMISIFLVLLGFTSIFAPLPIIFIFLLNGRKTGLYLGITCLFLSIVLAISLKAGPTLSVIYFLALITATIISEIIIRGFSPDKGIMLAGIIFGIIVLFGILVYYLIGSTEIQSHITVLLTKYVEQVKVQNADYFAKGGHEARILQDILKDPKKIVSNMMEWAPAMVFSSLMLGLWINFIIVLRSTPVWRKRREYAFTIRHLISFKAPEFLVWPLILSLGLLLGGEYILGSIGSALGLNFLYFLGVFYFIQGVGVYYDLLRLVGIRGGIRSLLVFLAILVAFRMMALVGVFDLWVNFRELFKKFKKNKGDN